MVQTLFYKQMDFNQRRSCYVHKSAHVLFLIKNKMLVLTDVRSSALYFMGFHTTVELGDKELFGQPEIVP